MGFVDESYLRGEENVTPRFRNTVTITYTTSRYFKYSYKYHEYVVIIRVSRRKREVEILKFSGTRKLLPLNNSL